MFRTLAFLSLSLFASWAQAQGVLPGRQVNGCGPDKVGFLVPDNIGRCKLKSACDRHDLCYGACLPGGQLEKTGVCGTGEKAAEARRSTCDARFYDDIVADNQGECGRWAMVYQFFVSKAGSCCFNGLPIRDFERIVSNAKTPEEAMRQLKYLEQLERSNAVDLSKIEFKADGSLVVPTVKPLTGLRGFSDGAVTVPRGGQIDQRRMKEVLRLPR